MSSRDLTKGPLWKALAAVSAPMSFGILAVLSVGLADAYFLGQLGQAPLAAVGFVYPVTTAITSLSIGLSAGANSAISQAIGRADDKGAPQRMALYAVLLGLGLAILVTGIFAMVARPLFSLMGASDQVVTEAMAFAPLWAISFPFLVVAMTLNAVFRAHGSGAISAGMMIFGAIFSIGLNPVLIFGWGSFDGLGTAGAAAATLTGRILQFLVVVTLALRWGYLKLDFGPSSRIGETLKSIVWVGGPAALSNAINPAGMAAVTAAVATLGDAAVAGFGAATRVQSVALVPLMALSAGIGPVVGQNWGADKKERARASVALTWSLCGGFGLMVGVAFALFADPLGRMFAAGDAEVAGFAAQYLRWVGWSLFGYGMLVTANAAMNARGQALYSMGLSLGRISLLYIPVAWIGASMFGYEGVLGAAVIANVVIVAAAVWALSRTNLLRGRDDAKRAFAIG